LPPTTRFELSCEHPNGTSSERSHFGGSDLHAIDFLRRFAGRRMADSANVAHVQRVWRTVAASQHMEHVMRVAWILRGLHAVGSSDALRRRLCRLFLFDDRLEDVRQPLHLSTRASRALSNLALHKPKK
jgi:hypothetical protein